MRFTGQYFIRAVTNLIEHRSIRVDFKDGKVIAIGTPIPAGFQFWEEKGILIFSDLPNNNLKVFMEFFHMFGFEIVPLIQIRTQFPKQ
jgi:hypothetical protein